MWCRQRWDDGDFCCVSRWHPSTSPWQSLVCPAESTPLKATNVHPPPGRGFLGSPAMQGDWLGVGLPEGNYSLYHCATALARSPKSREVTDLMYAAKDLARQFPNEPVPLGIRNAPTKLMKDLGYGKDYKWEANHQTKDGFLPPAVQKHITS